MNLIIIAACFAACYAAKLERSYLPPESAKTAGGSSEILQTPFRSAKDPNLPAGSYVNEFDGVVIDVDTAGTRATHSGLGGSRDSYGTTHSKVGDAVFRDTANLNQNNQIIRHPNGGTLPNVSGFRQPLIQGGEIAEDPGQMPILEPERFHASRDRASNIITYQNDIGIKDFNYAYQTDNGISAAENGIAVNGVRSQGGYSYTGDDGQVYTVSYTADEGGYRPQGAHLPTPPPIPVEILKALEQNAKDEAAGILDDGSYDAQKYNTGDTKGNSANDYNDRPYNMFEKGPGFSDVITAINQNSQASSKPNERYQDLTDTSRNNGLQSNQFNSNLNNFEYTTNNKHVSNSTNTNNQYPNRLDSSSITYVSINKNQSPIQSSQDMKDLDSATQRNTQFFLDNNNQQSFNIPLSQQNLQDQKESQDSLSGKPTSYEAPINGPTQEQESINNAANIFPIQFQNKANANDQSELTLSPGFTPSQFLNTNNAQPVSEINNNANRILVSSFPSSLSASSQFGSFNYQPSQQFGTVPHPVSSPVLLSTENKNREEQNNENNENRFHSNSFFLHKKFSLRKQQQINQQALSAFINSGNVENNVPNYNANRDSQYFSTTIKPSFEFSNQYNQNNNVFNNQLLTPTQRPSTSFSTFSSISNQLSQPGRVSQQTFSLAGVSSDNRPPAPVPSRLLSTPKEDKPEIGQGSPGLTQASISRFPSILPSISKMNENISGFDSLSQQKINLPTQSQNFGQFPFNGATNRFSENPAQTTNSQNQGEVYEYQKPSQSLPISSEKPSTLSQIPSAFNLPTQQPNNEETQHQQSAGITNIPQNQYNFLNRQNQEAPTTFVTTNQSDVEQSKIEPSQAKFGPKLLPSRPQFPSKSCCSFNQHKDTSLNNYNQSHDQSNFGSNVSGVIPQSATNNAQSVTKGEEFKGTQNQQAFDETGYHY